VLSQADYHRESEGTVARRWSYDEDGVAVAGGGFGSFLQHEGGPGSMRHYTNGGSGPVLTETMAAETVAT
jgi:hypothetical protein